MEGEQAEEEPAPETRIEVEIPKVSTDLGSDLYFVKLPNFLSVEPRSEPHLCQCHPSIKSFLSRCFLFITHNYSKPSDKIKKSVMTGRVQFTSVLCLL